MISVSNNACVIYNPKPHRHYLLSHSLRNVTFPPDIEHDIQLLLNYGRWLEMTLIIAEVQFLLWVKSTYFTEW